MPSQYTRQPCLCGCGGYPKKPESKYLEGHWWRGKKRRPERPANSPCLCGCGGIPIKPGSRYCNGHFWRGRQRSAEQLRPIAPAVDRFWSHIEKTEGCWLWTGSCDNHGYGHIGVDGRLLRAHRFSWELHFGPIPKGLVVCHKCDNPPCCRPDHLFLGTMKDNAVDCIKKGRGNRVAGEQHPQAKLTETDIRTIRRRHALGGITYQHLGDQYRVSNVLIGLIVRRKAWKHVL